MDTREGTRVLEDTGSQRGDLPVVLLAALQRLDKVLAAALPKAIAYFGASAQDNFRGLYISQYDVERLLDYPPNSPSLTVEIPPIGTNAFAQMLAGFELDGFDLDVLTLAIGPEVDLRYERIYGFLQDDVTRRRPTVDLALSLFCSSPADRLRRRAHFEPDAPLLRSGLVELVADASQVAPLDLTRFISLDRTLLHGLLRGPTAMDPTLAESCHLILPEANPPEVSANAGATRALHAVAHAATAHGVRVRAYLHGPVSSGQLSGAVALAQHLGLPLVAAEVCCTRDGPIAFRPWLQRVMRQSLLCGAMLYLDNLDELQREDAAANRQWAIDALGAHPGPLVMAGSYPWAALAGQTNWPPGEPTVIPFTRPGYDERCRWWSAALHRHDGEIPQADVEALASRFRLGPSQITAAVSEAEGRAALRNMLDGSPGATTLSRSELFVAARAGAGRRLEGLAKWVEPRYEWNDIILPSDEMSQLREICDQARFRHVVYEWWGFEQRLSRGRGLSVLFSGPPGTGKTMAAEVIANDLSLDLYRIDLSRVVSKYIGETEKNLETIFTAAESDNAVLLFDEADALFGKRSTVRDAHDRYANIEVGYLLQRIEEYDGVAILTTNLRANMDESFTRRLKFSIDFPFPDATHRELIWAGSYPDGAPLSDDIDFGFLASSFPLTGGHISNAALNASFMAAAEGSPIDMNHLLHAVRREFQKLGRAWTPPAPIGQPTAPIGSAP